MCGKEDIELRCQKLGKSTKTPGVYGIIEGGTRPHYSKLRRLSSDCYSPREDPKTPPHEDARTQPPDPPRTQAEDPRPNPQSARIGTRPAHDHRHHHSL